MDEKRQIQKELFEEFAKDDKKRHFKGMLQPKAGRTIILSYEHLIFIVMAFIITAALFFSLGVEKGKRLKASSLALTEKESGPAPVQIAKLPEPVQEEPAAAKEEVKAQPKEQPKLEKKEELAATYTYTVQLASYAKKDTADKDAQRLKKEGYQSFVFSSGNHYVVCVGKFNNRDQAASLQKKLRKLYSDCYVKTR